MCRFKKNFKPLHDVKKKKGSQERERAYKVP